MKKAPLAERIRPKSLDEVVGQTHLMARQEWERLLWQIYAPIR